MPPAPTRKHIHSNVTVLQLAAVLAGLIGFIIQYVALPISAMHDDLRTISQKTAVYDRTVTQVQEQATLLAQIQQVKLERDNQLTAVQTKLESHDTQIQAVSIQLAGIATSLGDIRAMLAESTSRPGTPLHWTAP